MPKYRIAAYWTMADDYYVEADSLREAIEKVACNEDNEYCITSSAEYVDGSFAVNEDCCEEVEQNEQH